MSGFVTIEKYHFVYLLSRKMLKQKLLSELIEEKISLGRENDNGWRAARCAVCNDHSERGGFIWDGIYTSYNCFNCATKFKYEEGTGKLSKTAKDVLEAFGITREILSELTSSIFLNQAEKEKDVDLASLTKVKLTTPEVAFPDRTRALLSDGHEALQEPILEYLIDRRIDPLKTKWYFSLDQRFLRRVIIPYWRDHKLIYWQARSIDAGVKPRYLNCVVAKDAVIYGYDQLSSYEGTPLFVTEGVFDAEIVDGIAILGSSLNAAKIEVLKRAKRRLIFVIDRDQTGGELGLSVLKNGWEITFVDLKAKDINDSVVKFGLPFTAYSLLKNATSKTDKLQSSMSLSMGLLEGRLRGQRK